MKKLGYDNQLKEFLDLFKNRFTEIKPFSKMPGKVGYSTQLKNNKSQLQVYIPASIPHSPPILYVYPPFQSSIIDTQGKIIDEAITKWNLFSNNNLANCVDIVLSKWEGNDLFQMCKWSKEEEEDIQQKLTKELSNKTISNLVFLYYKPNDWINVFTNKGKERSWQLLAEAQQWSSVYEQKTAEYQEILKMVEQCKHESEMKEQELTQFFRQKEKIDIKTLEKEVSQYIEKNYTRPKEELYNNFMNGKLGFEEFFVQFKRLSMEGNHYMILKDNLKS